MCKDCLGVVKDCYDLSIPEPEMEWRDWVSVCAAFVLIVLFIFSAVACVAAAEFFFEVSP